MSEQTMIDRVALAIWRKREENLPERLKRCTPDNMDRATGAWAIVQEEARVAIEAMRDFTDDMDLAGGFAVDRTNPYQRDIAGNVWTAMIDAALSSPTPSSGIGGVDGR